MTTAPPARTGFRFRTGPWIPALAAALLYAPTVRFGFVWDDEYFVVNNPAIRSWNQVGRYFTDVTAYAGGVWAPMFRPLRNISYLVDFTIAGMSPAWFHAHNVLLHALNAALVWWLLAAICALPRVSGSWKRVSPGFIRMSCTVAALAWAVHPVQTEAVAWIKSRDELLFSAFYLAGIWAAACSLRGGPGHPLLLPAAGLAAVGALLSKEMAITFPLVVCGVVMAGGNARRGHIRLIVACAATAVAYVVVRHVVIGKTEQTGYLAGTFAREMLTSVCASAHYVRLTVLGGPLLADYDSFRVPGSIADPRVLLSALVVASTLAAAFAARKRVPLAAAGIAWFWVTLLPVMNIIPTMQHLAERFLYLPLFGAALAAVGVALAVPDFLCDRVRLRRWTGEGARRIARNAAILVTVWVILLAVASAIRLPAWRDNLSIHEANWRESGGTPRTQLNYGIALGNAGRQADAVRVLEPLVSPEPRLGGEQLARAYEGLAMNLVAVGQLDAGAGAARKALAIEPKTAGAHAALGLVAGIRGDHRGAAEHYGRAAELKPFDAGIRANLELARRNSGGQTTQTKQGRQANGPRR